MSVSNYQRDVDEWLLSCFPAKVRKNKLERTHRFLEEALELAQANDCSKEDAISLVEYVFSREKGEPNQEVGGVMVTLASLCSATEIDMNEAGNEELDRNWSKIDTIRKKQASKPPNSPLPK